jgi:hypothetical protein
MKQATFWLLLPALLAALSAVAKPTASNGATGVIRVDKVKP